MNLTTAPVITFDRHSLIINGQPTLIRSGAMHYFRLPGQDMWRDRLYKLKAAGYNTVDLYFNWGFHSPAPNVYDFNGVRDLVALLALTRELGLYVIARPGPYINAETSGGGFPGWMLARRDLPLRNRIAGEYVWSDEYMGLVRQWWERLLPIINGSPNVILLQIENEYATPEMEPDTIQTLYKMARELGVTVPIFHNDLYIAGLYEDLVDIYAFDNYPITQFMQSWRGVLETFQVIDQLEETMRDYCMERPLMVAEMQAGWYGGWKGDAYETIKTSLGREQINIITKSVLGQGLTIFNHYMAIGGTNWNHLGSTEVITSYDFAAPISESGLNTERLFAAKALNQLLDSFAGQWAETDRLEKCPVRVGNAQTFYTARRPKGETEAAWIFFRNLSLHTTAITVEDRYEVLTTPSDMIVLPWKMPHAGGACIEFSTSELVFQNKQLLVVKAEHVTTLLLSQIPHANKMTAEKPLTIQHLADQQIEINCPALSGSAFVRQQLGDLTLLFLSGSLVDTLWIEPDGSLLIGPQMRLPQGAACLPETKTLLRLSTDGQTLQTIKVPKAKTLPTVDLSPPLFWPDSPELNAQRREQGEAAFRFVPVSAEGADFDANQHYEGSAWYRLRIGEKASTLCILARHHWAAYLNGQWLAHGEHLLLHPGQEIAEPATIQIPDGATQAGHANELLIFVTGLGHPKGFHDDAQTPQGIISLEVDGHDRTEALEFLPHVYSQRPALADMAEKEMGLAEHAVDHCPGTSELDKAANWPAGPIVRMETRFPLNAEPDVITPWSLLLQSADYERIDFWLNGILIGKDWLAGRRQDRFYLPESLLVNGENVLTLILMNFSTPITSDYLATHQPKIVIEPYAVLNLLP